MWLILCSQPLCGPNRAKMFFVKWPSATSSPFRFKILSYTEQWGSLWEQLLLTVIAKYVHHLVATGETKHKQQNNPLRSFRADPDSEFNDADDCNFKTELHQEVKTVWTFISVAVKTVMNYSPKVEWQSVKVSPDSWGCTSDEGFSCWVRIFYGI